MTDNTQTPVSIILSLPWTSFKDAKPPTGPVLVKLVDGTITGGWHDRYGTDPHGVEATYDTANVIFECTLVEWISLNDN